LWIRIRIRIGSGFKNVVDPDWGKMLDPDPDLNRSGYKILILTTGTFYNSQRIRKFDFLGKKNPLSWQPFFGLVPVPRNLTVWERVFDKLFIICWRIYRRVRNFNLRWENFSPYRFLSVTSTGLGYEWHGEPYTVHFKILKWKRKFKKFKFFSRSLDSSHLKNSEIVKTSFISLDYPFKYRKVMPVFTCKWRFCRFKGDNFPRVAYTQYHDVYYNTGDKAEEYDKGKKN
jgi:hypothetical protein